MMDLLELVPASVWTDAAVLLGGAGLTVLTLLRKRLVRLWNLRDSRLGSEVGGAVSVRALDDTGGVHTVDLAGVPRDDLWYFGSLEDPGFVPMEEIEEELDAGFDHRYAAVGGFVGRVQP